MSATAAFEAAQAKMNAAKEAMKATAKEALAEGSKALFEAYPNLVAFRWDQYTDYFNDGDTCNFHVHADQPDLCHMVDGAETWVEGDDICDRESRVNPATGRSEWMEKASPDPLVPISAAVSKMVFSFDTDTMQEVIGDHVTVTVHRANGVTTDTCEHD